MIPLLSCMLLAMRIKTLYIRTGPLYKYLKLATNIAANVKPCAPLGMISGPPARSDARRGAPGARPVEWLPHEHA